MQVKAEGSSDSYSQYMIDPFGSICKLFHVCIHLEKEVKQQNRDGGPLPSVYDPLIWQLCQPN